MLKNIIFSIIVFALLASHAVAIEYTSGLKPSARPDNAPKIEKVEHDSNWYSRALYGVSKPYPHSLDFLNSQGNWYTPFSKPGMLPPYDIRGWHK